MLELLKGVGRYTLCVVAWLIATLWLFLIMSGRADSAAEADEKTAYVWSDAVLAIGVIALLAWAFESSIDNVKMQRRVRVVIILKWITIVASILWFGLLIGGALIRIKLTGH